MQSFLDEGKVRLIARLGRRENFNNEALVVERANRVGFEFDGVDALADPEAILAAMSGKAGGDPLAILRVLTTSWRFEELAGREQPTEGDWYALDLLPRGKQPGPLAWAAPLEAGGYTSSRPFVLAGAEWLFHEDDRPLLPLSAAVAPTRTLAQSIAAACEFPKSAIGRVREARDVLANLPPIHQVVAHDVGQASFISLHDIDGVAQAHLDAGWPVSWNRHTAPARPPAVTNLQASVILSHWDWDHLHAYHKTPALAAMTWITPVQRLSPNKQRIASSLAAQNKLLGIGTRTLAAGDLTLGRCNGARGDSNNTGLAAQVVLASGKRLLFVGDADYSLAPTWTKIKPPDLLVVTHHGAKFGGAAPTASWPGAPAVVSVGKNNSYGHPSAKALGDHHKAGWSLEYTHASRTVGRVLGP